tara:strand:+ start:362 stop:817 length:456 start_codon:yes stop_codon:yes gene_type:complete
MKMLDLRLIRAQQVDFDTAVSRILLAYYKTLGTKFEFAGEPLSHEEVFSEQGFLPAIDYLVKLRSEMLGSLIQQPIRDADHSGLLGYRLCFARYDNIENATYKYMCLTASEDIFFSKDVEPGTTVNLDPIFHYFTQPPELREAGAWKPRKF